MSSRQQRRAQAKAERAANATSKGGAQSKGGATDPRGNREMRRFAAKEEERAKKRRAAGAVRQRKERVGFQQFVREVRQELKKVAWPTRQETTTYTVVVLVVTVVLTAITFGLDLVLKRGILSVLGA